MWTAELPSGGDAATSDGAAGEPSERGRPSGRTDSRSTSLQSGATGSGAVTGSGAGRFAPGTMIGGRYRIVALLGRGGMGEVYRADDLRLDQPVALKFLPPSLARDARRLEQLHSEVRLARQIAHPNVARVYDIGDTPEISAAGIASDPAARDHFLTMEFVDGEDLASLLRRVGSPNPGKSAEIARQLCAGLAALHERGLLHRDLKPANIMIDGRGAVRIMDFGLALSAADGASSTVVAGTPAYMAPEQFTGGPLTRATDIYALGLILAELFTGRHPVRADTLEQYRAWHTSGETATVADSLATLEPAVERAIIRCLERDPGHRPPSALAVAAMLPGGDPIAAALAAGETPSPEAVAAAGRAARLSAAVAVTLLVSVIIVVGAWLALPAPDRPWEFLDNGKSPDVLRDRAAQLLTTFERPPGESDAWGFAMSGERARWLARAPDLAAYDDRITDDFAAPLEFYHRTSPSAMVATNPFARVFPRDPPMNVAGMTTLVLDASGRLRRLETAPDPSMPSDPPMGVAAAMERSTDALFDAAGLDRLRFAAVAPDHHPRVFADTVSAWVEREPARLDGPLRVEAAFLLGRVVQVETFGPWSVSVARDATDEALIAANAPGSAPEAPVETRVGAAGAPSSTTTTPASSSAAAAPTAAASALAERTAQVTRITSAISMVTMVLMTAFMVILAFRHVRSGRGDRRGARRLSTIVFLVALPRWICLSDPSLSASYLNVTLTSGVGLSLLAAAVAWLLYMALEPFTRRLWPSTMITWHRLVQGRWSDPRVGRDLLVGALGGAMLLLLESVGMAIDGSLGHAPGIEFGSGATPWHFALAGAPRVLGLVLLALQSALVAPMATLLLLILLRLVVRRGWLAATLLWIIFAAVGAMLASSTSGMVVAALSAAIILFVLVRFGLVAMMAVQLVVALLTMFPATLKTDEWFFNVGLVGIAATLAVAAYGCWAALAGRPTPTWETALTR